MRTLWNVVLEDLGIQIYTNGCFADGAVAVLFRNALFGVVDCLCCRLFPESGNVTRFVVYVRDVDVYQTQTDLFQLRSEEHTSELQSH